MQGAMTSLKTAAKAAIAALPQNQRIMALDLGSTTIGIATADHTRKFATPRFTIARTKFQADAKALLEFCERENIGLIVIGLPLNMDGTEGRRAQSTRAFARNLVRLTDLPIIYWDERLSTFEAEQQMIEAGIAFSKHDEQVDMRAAAVILQGVLDGVG
jgi:putative holliday junction resolvase